MKKLLPLLVVLLLAACIPGYAPQQVPANAQTGVANGINAAQTSVVSFQQTALADTTTTPQSPYTVIGIVDYTPNSFKILFSEGINTAIYASNSTAFVEFAVDEKVVNLEGEAREYSLYLGVNADQWGGEDFALEMKAKYPNAVVVVWHERDLTKKQDLLKNSINVSSRAQALVNLKSIFGLP